MKFHVGYYKPVPTFRVPKFTFSTKNFFIDVDFTPVKQAWQLCKWFPFGWCAAAGFPGSEPPWDYRFHWSWHALYGEPDRIDVKMRGFTWSHDFSESRW